MEVHIYNEILAKSGPFTNLNKAYQNKIKTKQNLSKTQDISP